MSAVNYHWVVLSGDQVTTIWTTVAAACGALGGAALGGFITYRVTCRQISSAEGVAVSQREHEKELAYENRRQERLLHAYVVVMRSVLFNTRTIEWKLREMTFRTDPPQQAPPIDPLDPAEEAGASLVASGEVGGLLRGFNDAIARYSVALGSLSRLEGLRGGGTLPTSPEGTPALRELSTKLEEAGQKAIKIGNTLVERMRTELGAIGTLPTDTSGWEELRAAALGKAAGVQADTDERLQPD